MADLTEKGTENAVEFVNAPGHGAAATVCEHASTRIPARYGGLGLDAAARRSHAPLVACRISRLVRDCNRPSSDPSAVTAQDRMADEVLRLLAPALAALTPREAQDA